MKPLKCLLLWVLCLFWIADAQAQTKAKVSLKDLQKACGHWTGSLTYIDYSSGKPYTMPADLEVKRIGKTNRFAFANLYPDEPNANDTDTLTLAADGKSLNGETVKSRRKLSNGDIEVVTEEAGRDGNDNKPATFRHTYLFGKTKFSRKKEVQFQGETTWIKRHEYRYERKKHTGNR